MIQRQLDVALALWIGLPPAWQTVLLVVFGLAGGALANHAIASWCWFRRPLSPWTNPRRWPLSQEAREAFESVGPRRPWDRIPVAGWLFLRRERDIFGPGFWIRPILIELGLAITLPWMHQAWIDGRLLPAGVAPGVVAACVPWMTQLFFIHAILLVIMVAATFIDFDERTIPDVLTIPGTLFGLCVAAASPRTFLPVMHIAMVPHERSGIRPVLVTEPGPHDAWWLGVAGLWTGLAVWTIYCFALADRRVILRHGYRKAMTYFFARLLRHWSWKLIVAMWVLGSAGIVAVYRVGGLHWLGLVTSLVGLAVGGGIVWSIRLVGRWALQKEAMGFGDVTLMAMIGSIIGWQASIAAFFLSPMAAILIVLVRYVVTRDTATPFGPYLCVGTLATLWWWDAIYNYELSPLLLSLGGILLWFSLAILLLLGGMLFVWRIIKTRLLGVG